MTKSSMYFWWGISLFIFLLIAISFLIALIVTPYVNSAFSDSSFRSWTDRLGMIVGLIVLIPIYKLFKLRTKIKFGIEKFPFVTVLLLFLWFIIPYTYSLASDKLLCFEASIIPSGGLPARCYTQNTQTPKIFELIPSSGPVGTQITIKGQGFIPVVPNGNQIRFGDPGPYHRELDGTLDNVVGYPASKDGTTIIFPVPVLPGGRWCDSSNNCNIELPVKPRAPGIYNVSVSTKNGVSEPVPFTITP